QAAWTYLAAYAASKAAVEAMSRALRAEVAGQGIRVMTVQIHNVASEFGARFEPALLPAALGRSHELGLVNPDPALRAPPDGARAVVFQLTQPDPASIHELTIRLVRPETSSRVEKQGERVASYLVRRPCRGRRSRRGKTIGDTSGLCSQDANAG